MSQSAEGPVEGDSEAAQNYEKAGGIVFRSILLYIQEAKTQENGGFSSFCELFRGLSQSAEEYAKGNIKKAKGPRTFCGADFFNNRFLKKSR